MWIALAVLLLAIVVACVLVFVVFYDDIFKGGDASTPEGAVTKFFDAMEDKDIDAVFEVMDMEALTGMLGDDYVDLAKEAMADELFGEGSISFSGIKLETEQTSSTTATVTVVEGSATITYDDGEKETEEIADSDDPVALDLTKKDGSWYIDPMTFDF